MVTKQQLITDILDYLLAERYPEAHQINARKGLNQVRKDRLESIREIVKREG
jgi:hypothetical protein